MSRMTHDSEILVETMRQAASSRAKETSAATAILAAAIFLCHIFALSDAPVTWPLLGKALLVVLGLYAIVYYVHSRKLFQWYMEANSNGNQSE